MWSPPDGWITRHSFAAVIHLIALATLLIVAHVERDLSEYEKQFWYIGTSLTTRKWLRNCGQHVPCTDNTPIYVPQPRSVIFIKGPFNTGIVGVASLYVFWSSVMHWLTWAGKVSAQKSKWIDYCITAPIMLSVLGSVSFGVRAVGFDFILVLTRVLCHRCLGLRHRRLLFGRRLVLL